MKTMIFLVQPIAAHRKITFDRPDHSRAAVNRAIKQKAPKPIDDRFRGLSGLK